MRNKNFRDFCVSKNISLVDAMRKMNVNGQRTLFVVDEEMKIQGSLSAGDIRRWILDSGGKLDTNIKHIVNIHPIFLRSDCSQEEAKQKMLEHDITILPVLDYEERVKNILLWTDIFGKIEKHKKISPNISVVIMAGGIGSRMKPFTNVLPKPLLPINDKPVVEVIMDRFHDYGINEFFMVVNFKKGMIISYFENTDLPYTINFVDEGELLGTCGGLRKIDPERLSKDFFLTNCDSVIAADFEEIYNFHTNNMNDITLLSTIRDFKIPYGVVDISITGKIERIVEKPTFNFLVNTGTYIIKKRLIDTIPHGKKFETPTLINNVIGAGGKIGLFPLTPEARLDTGEWSEYHKTLEVLENKNKMNMEGSNI